MREINEIIIHCSATDVATYDFKAIQHDHVNNRGWSDTGYHFGIDYDGDIHILRPIQRSGAHCRGRNKNSIGICLLGLTTFTHPQFEQLGRLCDCLGVIFALKKSDVKAHNFYNKNKTCPNFDLEMVLDQYMRVR